MTLYVDETYYLDTFEGKLISSDDLDKYLPLAQEKIDSITFNRIVYIGFDKLTSFQQDKIKRAICYQAEHIFNNGYNNEDNNDISSYNVLDINVNVNNNYEKTEAEKLNMSEIAYDLIKKTGLTDRSFRF